MNDFIYENYVESVRKLQIKFNESEPAKSFNRCTKCVIVMETNFLPASRCIYIYFKYMSSSVSKVISIHVEHLLYQLKKIIMAISLNKGFAYGS